MAFVHKHKDGSFWFITQDKLPDIDRADIGAESPGFTSEEVSAKTATTQLEQYRTRHEHLGKEDKEDKENRDIVVEATPTPKGKKAP
jgi:hypothetical protein